MESHADQRGLIVISAEAVQPLAKWNFKDRFHAEAHDDVGLVSKVIEALLANQVVDPAVYARGIQWGSILLPAGQRTRSVRRLVSHELRYGRGRMIRVKGRKPSRHAGHWGPGQKFQRLNQPESDDVFRIEANKVWRTYNQCLPDPVVENHGDEIVVRTYSNQSGLEVAFCQVKDRDITSEGIFGIVRTLLPWIFTETQKT